MKKSLLFKVAFTCNTILKLLTTAFKEGHISSSWKWSSENGAGKPLPWYTYPAIKYLQNLDLSSCTVFEFGSGNSTLWWEKRVKKVVAVEDNAEWFNLIKSKISSGTNYILANSKKEYLSALADSKNSFDVIIIDGSHRMECFKIAEQKLKDTGFIILDNSDRYTQKLDVLAKKLDAIRIDFVGFGPINGYQWCTSIFFKRNSKMVNNQRAKNTILRFD